MHLGTDCLSEGINMLPDLQLNDGDACQLTICGYELQGGTALEKRSIPCCESGGKLNHKSVIALELRSQNCRVDL